MPINRHAVEVGVLVGVADLLIFQHFMPPVTDIRRAEPFNGDIESSERTALLVTVGFTLLVSGFVRSLDTFLIGGAVIVGVDFAFKHANAVNPDTGKLHVADAGSLDMATVHNLPDYSSSSGQ
jgi:hypothetical protein